MTIRHGFEFTETVDGGRYLQTASTSVIGLAAIASDADVQAFPAGVPVLITDVRAAIDKAGVQGTLAASLTAIAAQADPIVVVVRAAPAGGADAAAISTAVCGAIQKLETAPAAVRQRPTVLGAPGLETATVIAQLASTAPKLRGMAYASVGNGTIDTVAEAITARDAYGARELMLIYPDFMSGTTKVQASAAALGLRAQIDATQGWNKTLSNVPVAGVTGVSQALGFDIQSADNDVGLLNAAEITSIVEFNGYRFWGSRTCSDEPAFAFESAVRTSQILRQTLAEGLTWALDKPITKGLARDIIEEGNAKAREMARNGQLVGAEFYLDTPNNTPQALSAGRLAIAFDYTPTPPLECLGITQRITDRFFLDFALGAAAG